VILILILSGSVARADPVRCKPDLERARGLAGTAGYSNVLTCDGERLEDVYVQVGADGGITGMSWTEYQGEHLRRTIRVDRTGSVFFIVQNRGIKGGFFAQTRGTAHFVFPRDHRMTVIRDRRSRRLLLRDAAGHAWQLAGTPVEGPGMYQVSYVVEAIDGHAQPPRTIGFGLDGIVAVDLVGAGAMYLEHREPHRHGLADRRSRKYLSMRSLFHDGAGHSCAIENRYLFGPRAADPDDKSDNELRFADDGSLAAFLGERCPELDLAALGGDAAVIAR
jgi:hypothetical protein